MEIASKGWHRAMRENPEIRYGANVVLGHITYKAVAERYNQKLWIGR